MSDLAERLQAIRERLRTACERSGRELSAVELLAVSKTFPIEAIREAMEAGQLLFGENKVQEVLVKVPALPSNLRWHLIGHLQSNKVRKVLPHVDAVHSVDSLDLARDIQRIGGELGLFPKVYLEVNLAAESTKHGFKPADLREGALDALYEMDRLHIQGLMCIPPFDPLPEKTRPYFATLRQVRDELEKRGGAPLPKLSMGMSHDFEVAIEEGATIVRVGSALFGERTYSKA
jgi:pyridoxal phosphate enzyme (YggS family)